MGVERAALLDRKLVVQVGGEVGVDVVVDGHVIQVKRGRDEVVCASRRGRGRGFLEARHY